MQEPKMVSDTFAIGFIAFIWFMVFMVAAPRKKKRNPYDELRIVQPIPAMPKKTKPVKPVSTKSAKPKETNKINPDTLKAMHIQADAERAIADALSHKAQREKDPVKKARIEKQIANSNLRFNNILDKIDKLTQ